MTARIERSGSHEPCVPVNFSHLGQDPVNDTVQAVDYFGQMRDESDQAEWPRGLIGLF